MSTSTSKKHASQARRAAHVAAARRRAQRRMWAVRGGAGAIAAVIVVLILLALASREREDPETAVSATATADVTEFDVPSRDHVTADVDYPQSPPVGGDHDAAWQTCGTYYEPVRDENAVHSMEHGAVWITYRPGLDQAQVDTLVEAASGQTHLLVTPRDDLGSPIVLSAWGRQLAVDTADDESVARFIREFQEGPETPELGAPCSGGIGTPG